MSLKNNPEPGADDGSGEPDVSATELRDFFIDEERLGVSDISQAFEISEETSEALLEQLSQSGIVQKHPRRKSRGGNFWTLEYPHLRVRSSKEVANESPLAYKAHLDGEPRDEEVTIEDVLELLADFEDNHANLSTTQAATKLQITPRHARDLLDELTDRGVAGRREVEPPHSMGNSANMYWLSDSYSVDDVEQLLYDPEPEPDAVDQLNDALDD